MPTCLSFIFIFIIFLEDLSFSLFIKKIKKNNAWYTYSISNHKRGDKKIELERFLQKKKLFFNLFSIFYNINKSTQNTFKLV
jgi:hypothetical protein